MCRPFVTVPAGRTWVFFLGCYDSGTSLLHDLIGRSRQCSRLPGEGAFLTGQLPTPEDFGWTRLWWRVQTEMEAFGSMTGGNPDIVKSDWCIWYDTRRPFFLEKSISNAVRIAWLDKFFDSPKFIYIIRNGYAVAEGIRRRAGKGRYRLPRGLKEYPIEWCAQQWVSSAEVIDKQLAKVHPTRIHRVVYETLCEDPHGTVSRIGHFLQLPDLGGVDYSHVRSRNRDSISRLSQADLVQVNRVAAKTFQQNGYEVISDPLPPPNPP